MNKTLLLIICDFLLLNLLALTRWEKVEPVVSRTAPIPTVAANTTRPQQEDLLAAMRMALEDEKGNREKLAETLKSEAQTRALEAAKSEQQRRQLETAIQETKLRALETQQKLEVTATQAAQARELLAQSQSALNSRQADAERQQKVLTESIRAAESEKQKLLETLSLQQHELQRQREASMVLEKEKSSAEKRASEAVAATKVAEVERNYLRTNVADLKKEVVAVQLEKEKVQTQTATLAAGVTQLAAKSDEITREIREGVPINANIMFSEFLSNRVQVSIAATSPGFISESARQKDTSTALVTDGIRTVALVHVSDTPFSIVVPNTGYDQVRSRVQFSGRTIGNGPLYFSAIDPRVIALPVDRAQAQTLGVKVYPMARNPFKFAEAVLISRGGRYYGEVEFKLDPRTPDYVKMKSKILSRMFGEFSPSTGDLVLSKSGEFLGVMVNSDYCWVARSLGAAENGVFDPQQTRDQTRVRIEGFRAQLDRLPLSLR